MARRSSSRITAAQRDNSYITSRAAVPSVFRLSSVLPGLISELEDRRRFHPNGDYRRAASFSSVYQSSVVAKPVRNKLSRLSGDVFRFAVPEKVAVCVRRKARREVLFAMVKTGKGSSRSFRRRNYYSDVSCKR